jgi:D-glycerate 3-kinase
MRLSSRYPDNPLLQHRGLPSTHDIELAKSIFSTLRQNSSTSIPRYNKAAFGGQGDRDSEDHWQSVNVEGQNIVKIVIFEGWSVGFRPLSEHQLQQKWQKAATARETGHYLGRLGHVAYNNIAQINDALREYDSITE